MANINAIKLPDGNKYNLVDETSGYITSSDLPTPLIGTTANTTPTQVVTALAAGRNIEITHTDTTYGDIIAYSFNYAEDIGRISSNAAISVFGTLILAKLVGNTSDNTWNFEAHELAQLSNIPTATSDLTNDSGFVTTDEKVRVSALSSNTVYYPILASGTGVAVRQVDSTYNGFRYCSIAGTASSVGSAQLQLGNSIASGSENNERGRLTIYGKTAYAHTIQGAPTAARTLTLPDKAGTFALIDDIPISTDVPTASTISEFDSTAHMNSTDMTAAEVTSFVSGLSYQAPELVDIFYPVGSYYETSDITFDPNISWGGVWSLEAAGQVHVSAGTGYSVAGALTNTSDGGATTSATGNHTLVANELPKITGTFRVRGYQTSAGGNGATLVSTSGVFTEASGGSLSVVKSGVTSDGSSKIVTLSFGNNGAHDHGSVSTMQPYIVVNRWHRTA